MTPQEQMAALLAELSALDDEIAACLCALEQAWRDAHVGVRLDLVEIDGHRVEWGKADGAWTFLVHLDGQPKPTRLLSLPRHIRMEFYAWARDTDRLYTAANEALAREVAKRRAALDG
jgi:hypothetical protein